MVKIDHPPETRPGAQGGAQPTPVPYPRGRGRRKKIVMAVDKYIAGHENLEFTPSEKFEAYKKPTPLSIAMVSILFR